MIELIRGRVRNDDATHLGNVGEFAGLRLMPRTPLYYNDKARRI